MLYPLPALAAFLLMRNHKVSSGERAGATAVAAITPSILGLAPAVIAAGVAGRGGGFGEYRGRRRLRPLFRTPAPTPQPEPDTAPTLYKVPNVIGDKFSDAQAALTKANLVAGRFDVHTDQPAETVIDQDTRPDRYMAEGAVIGLTVSMGPKQDKPDEMTELKLIEQKFGDLRDDVDGKFKTIQDTLDRDDIDTRLKKIQDSLDGLSAAQPPKVQKPGPGTPGSA